jgi:hypothetical protein
MIGADVSKARHLLNRDSIWQEYLKEMGLENKLSLFEQPAKSPDLKNKDLSLRCIILFTA